MSGKQMMTAAMLLALSPLIAKTASAPYPAMAPIQQYLIADRSEEISLARSAAPESISAAAEVLVLTRHSYQTAVKGTNGFVCIVERSWSAGIDDSDFWNPKLRAPICFNSAGAKAQLPPTMARTQLVLAGSSKEAMFKALKEAVARRDWPPPSSGAMCYMMSKRGYLNDRDGHWHPHLMFFEPQTDPNTWGANLPGSPVIALKDTAEGITVFLVPVTHWSDGTPSEAH
jgi:hypothetical protein